MTSTPETRADRLAELLAATPYIRFLGMTARLGDGAREAVVSTELPFSQHLIGNTSLPALHGGAIGAFMELTALAALAVHEPTRRQPRTIDVTIEYLRTGRPIATYAEATVRKIGRRIANVQVEAWQSDRAAPVAALRGHFMLGEARSAGQDV